MSKINLMNAELANRIAAGEVIDRPASVVKELVENSIDAKSKRIQISISEAGKKEIRVADDGTGMDRTILSGIHAYYEPEELVGKTCIAIVNLPPRAMMGIDSCGMLISAVHQEEGVEKLHLLMVDDHIPAGAKLY